MKFPQTLSCVTLVIASVSVAHATAYYAGFDAPIYNPGTGPLAGPGASPATVNDLSGQRGWAIDGSNLPASAPLLSAFVDIPFGGGDVWGTLGGQWSTPNTTSIELTHSAVIPLNGSVFQVDVDIIGSTVGTRDKFGWSLKDSGASDLVRIAFEPGQPGLMHVLWYDGANVAHSTGHDIAYGAPYTIQLAFDTPVGGDLTLYGKIIGSNTVPFTGTLTGAASATVATVNADFDLTGTAAGAGDNYMAFNNLAVPEPSSMLTAGLALIGLAGRRRRK